MEPSNMANAQQVKRTAIVAIVVGIFTMALSGSMAASSLVAAGVTFVVGLAVAAVGVLKIGQAAKARG